MFDISNELSYANSMISQTGPASSKLEKLFVMNQSAWIDVDGDEKGAKNHFVVKQGRTACDIIVKAFNKNNGIPDLYVISPFKSVISELRDMIKELPELKHFKKDLEKWCDEYCGTVHKFQGKEASEVVFLLGCDKRAKGAVRWVKPNIVNVAVTRAKYRIYIIGEYEVWKQSEYFRLVKRIIDRR